MLVLYSTVGSISPKERLGDAQRLEKKAENAIRLQVISFYEESVDDSDIFL